MLFLLSGDGRNDSPGHSALYLTYTLLDHMTKQIMAMTIVDKREVGLKSPNMEKVGLMRGLKELAEQKMKVTELVTDAHIQIESMISKLILLIGVYFKKKLKLERFRSF